MAQYVRNKDRPLLERMRELAPSKENPRCECAGDYQCSCCVVAEALAALEKAEDVAARAILALKKKNGGLAS